MDDDEARVTLASIDSAWMATTDEVLKRLRVLASIDVGNKVNTRMHYVYRNTWVARVFRTIWHTESREHAVSYARAAVDGLSAVAARVAVEKQPVPDEIRTELLSAAMGARDGLVRLSRTYESDVGVSSALASQATRISVLCRFMTTDSASKHEAPDHHPQQELT
jgi:hypothetical protein